MRFLSLAFGVLAVACSSSSSSPTAGNDAGGGTDATTGGDAGPRPDGGGGTTDGGGGTDASQGVDAGPCGMTFYANDYEPSCQLLLDNKCCDQEKACGGDPACTTRVKCINDCVPPRDPTCIDACGASQIPTLDAITSCMKTYTVPPGLNCAWPQ